MLHLGLLLSGFGLGCLLLVTVDHHNSNKGAHHSGTQESEDNGDADGPNTGWEDIVERVAGVDKGLQMLVDIEVVEVKSHTINRVHAV
jgi:hypothetical protein